MGTDFYGAEIMRMPDGWTIFPDAGCRMLDCESRAAGGQAVVVSAFSTWISLSSLVKENVLWMCGLVILAMTDA